MTLLAPLFIGGVALLVIPYLIHKIRRPEGERLKFSSVMFIPKARREVIERRRIQHILLMLLRMLALALLAFAFARPALRATPDPSVTGRRTRVMILVDRSYSMGYGARLAEAKSQAENLVASLARADKVGVIAFDAAPEILSPLERAEALETAEAEDSTASPDEDDETGLGSKTAAIEAIRRIELTEKTTAYHHALRMAQDELLAAREKVDERPDRLMIYMISDFQRRGLDDKASWRLSPEIEFTAIDVAGETAPKNLAINDLTLRKTGDGQLKIVGQIKNWSESQEMEANIGLIIDDAEIETKTMTIKPGAATQVSFIRPLENRDMIAGRLQLAPDDLELDNHRHFVWSPPLRKNLVLLKSEGEPGRYPASFFLTKALPNAAELPWRLETLDVAGSEKEIEARTQRPDLIIVGDTSALTPESAATLEDFAKAGGALLLVLGGSENLPEPALGLLQAAGLEREGSRFKTTGESFALISWIDFSHPTFAPFQGSRLNDFSQIRFMNFHRLKPSNQDGGPRIVAKFEPDELGAEPPAALETRIGTGRVIVWNFGLALEESNLGKSVKFLPLLQETISFLTGARDTRRSWLIGQTYDGRPEQIDAAPEWTLAAAGTDPMKLALADARQWPKPLLERSGLLTWTAEGAAAPSLIEAVNIEASESDTRRLDVKEFETHLISSIVAADASGEEVVDQRGRKLRVKQEYWRWLMGLFLVGAALETLVASRIQR